MDLHNENERESSYVFGSALMELAHIVKACLEHGASAHEAIEAVAQSAEMGCVKYPIRWIALDPRVHYFPNVEMAIANALLSVPPTLRVYYAEEKIPFRDLVCAVSRHVSSDGAFYVYAVVVGLNEVFSHVTVGHAVSAGRQDIEDAERDLGF